MQSMEGTRNPLSIKKLLGLTYVFHLTLSPSHYLYKSKMDEFGSIITIERVVKSLKFLEVSQDNFTLVITGPIPKLVCEMLSYSFVPCSYEGKFIIDLCSFLCFVA